MSIARQALEKLLRSAERASITGNASRDLVFSDASFAPYGQCKTRAALDEVHTELLSAQRAGAIKIEWDPRAGEHGQIERIAVVDRDALAERLGIVPRWVSMERARSALAGHDSAQVRALVEAWSAGKSPRSRGPEHIGEFVDALKVLEGVRQARSPFDLSLRRFSAATFADSKHIDGLDVALDLLTREDDGPPRSAVEVFSSLGLVVHPQPFLIAGKSLIAEVGEGTRVTVPAPYIGLAPQSLTRLHGTADYVLSVENLDTFHELALGAAGPVSGIVLYTAGMPSPAWLHAYGRVLASIPPATKLFHWGDTDVGGVRILRAINDFAKASGRTCAPFQMGIPGDSPKQEISEADAAYLARISRSSGWLQIAEHFEACRNTYEQQTQTLRLPSF